MKELDKLKRTEPESRVGNSGRDYKAREASRTIEAVQKGELSLLNNGKLLFYSKRITAHNGSFDEEIETTVSQYLRERSRGEKVVFLTGDRNLRILSRSDESLIVANPVDWATAQHGKQEYIQKLKQAIKVDEQVNLAHKKWLRIEARLRKLQAEEDEETTKELRAKLVAAEQKERQELERFSAEQRKLEIEEDQKLRLANCNRHSLTISDLRLGLDKRIFSVMDNTYNQVGEIVVEKFWRYFSYQYKIITIHISARIAGYIFPLVAISASKDLLYPLSASHYFLFPPENNRIEAVAGSWKLLVQIDNATIAPAPHLLPNGVFGQYPIFQSFSLTVDAVELIPEEGIELNHQKEMQKQLEDERRKGEKRENTRAWIIIGISLAAVGVILCSVASIILGYLVWRY